MTMSYVIPPQKIHTVLSRYCPGTVQVLSRYFVASQTHVRNGCEGLKGKANQKILPMKAVSHPFHLWVLALLRLGIFPPLARSCLSGPCMVFWGFSCSLWVIESLLSPSVPPPEKESIETSNLMFPRNSGTRFCSGVNFNV